MFATTLYFDKVIPPGRLASAMADATGTDIEQIRVITQEEFERAPWPWFRESDLLGLTTSNLRGEFPFAIDLVARPDINLRSTLDHIARSLHVAVLTDEFDVNPLSDAEWLMVSADGSFTKVIADPEAFGADDPAIILEPESHAVHEAKRSKRVAAAG